MEIILPLLLSLIIIGIVFFSLSKLLNKFSRPESPDLETFTQGSMTPAEILSDLDTLIEEDCQRIFSIEFPYYAAKHQYSKEMSALTVKDIYLTNEMVEDYTLDLTSRFMEEMSPTYRSLLETVKDPNFLEEYILRIYYYKISKKAIEINRTLSTPEATQVLRRVETFTTSMEP